MSKNNAEIYFYCKYSHLFILLICTPFISGLCFYSTFTWFYEDAFLCYLLIAIAVLGILLSMYCLCFLLLNGRPYIKLTPEQLEVHFYVQRKIIPFEQMLKSDFHVIEMNALQTLYEYEIVYQHEKISLEKNQPFKILLNPLNENDRAQFILLTGFLYYTPLHLRTELIEKYIKKQDFTFSDYMDARLQLWLNDFGYLPILPHNDYVDFLNNTEFLLQIDQNDDKKDK